MIDIGIFHEKTAVSLTGFISWRLSKQLADLDSLLLNDELCSNLVIT